MDSVLASTASILDGPAIAGSALSDEYQVPNTAPPVGPGQTPTPAPVPEGVSFDHLQGQLVWWTTIGHSSSAHPYTLSLIAIPDSVIAERSGIDQVERFNEYTRGLHRCAVPTATIEQMRTGLSTLLVPSLGWRKLNGFGIGKSWEEVPAQPDPLVEILAPSNECTAQAQRDTYGDALLVAEVFDGTLDDNPEETAHPPSVYLIDRDITWRQCMSALAVEFNGWMDIQNYVLATYGIVELDDVTALSFDDALAVEIRIATADWICAEPDRNQSDTEHLEREPRLYTGMSVSLEQALNDE